MIHYNIKHYLATSIGIGLSVLGLAGTPLAQAAANLDSTFGTNGVVLTPTTVYNDGDVAVQSDGKIVTLYAEQLVRYNANGTRDASFVTPLVASASSYRASVAIQATDGKIVTTGAALSRYNSGGSLDASFGTAGHVSVSGTSQLAFQSDGKIIVTKFTYTTTDSAGIPYYSNQLARYTVNGILDTTFGVNGIVNYGETPGSGLLRLVTQPDNKILVGSGANGVTVTRYGANGILDSSFGTNGVAVVSFTPPITSANIQCLFYNGGFGLANILVQSDGKIVVVGNSGQCNTKNVSHNEFSLARFNSNGTLDSTFGSGGKVVTPNPNATGRALYDGAIQANGKIVAVGYIFNPKRSANDFAIMRYNTDGSVDSTLSGVTTIDYNAVASGIAIQADGKSVAIGYSATTVSTAVSTTLVRYLP